jgi:AraC-like DNA-binding protein
MVHRVVTSMTNRLGHALTNEALAEIAFFSPYHFNRIFRNATGVPPVRFLYALRLQRAKELLIKTERSITDICFDVGYGSLGTFTTRFKAVVGATPKAFRRLSRVLGGMRLSDLRPFLNSPINRPACTAVLTGTIDQSPSFDGVVFLGLFGNPIPEGEPAACSLARSNQTFEISIPGAGPWHLMAVAAPWTADGASLLTFEGFARGKAGPIIAKGGIWSGKCKVTLGASQFCDPPILTAIPLFVSRLLSHDEPQKSDIRASLSGRKIATEDPDWLMDTDPRSMHP